MSEFLNILSNVLYVFFIISCVVFGISIAFNIMITIVLNKIDKESDNNFNCLENNEKEKVNDVINTSKEKLNLFLQTNKKIKKIKNKNKIRKFLKLKELNVPVNNITIKNVISDILQNVYSSVNHNEERGFLSFSEREIFYILNKLKDRIETILNATNIIWLKRIKISFIMLCLGYYNEIENLKNKTLILIVFYLLNFFSWFSRVISPVGVSKYIFKNYSGKELNIIVTNTICEVICKELAVIYKQKENQIYSKKSK